MQVNTNSSLASSTTSAAGSTEKSEMQVKIEQLFGTSISLEAVYPTKSWSASSTDSASSLDSVGYATIAQQFATSTSLSSQGSASAMTSSLSGPSTSLSSSVSGNTSMALQVSTSGLTPVGLSPVTSGDSGSIGIPQYHKTLPTPPNLAKSPTVSQTPANTPMVQQQQQQQSESKSS